MMINQIKLNRLNYFAAQSKASVLDRAAKRQKFFWLLFCCLIALLGCYFYFVTQTIINTANYQSLENKISVLDSEISEIEAQYIVLKKEINLDLTKKLGYVEATNIKFINKKKQTQALSLAPNNRQQK